jgi:hypothetical protein
MKSVSVYGIALPSSYRDNKDYSIKARSLKRGNPGLPMETIARHVGYPLSHLYLVLKEEDNEIQPELSIFINLKY